MSSTNDNDGGDTAVHFNFDLPANQILVELALHLHRGGFSTEDYLALDCVDEQGTTWKLGVFLVERPPLKLVARK